MDPLSVAASITGVLALAAKVTQVLADFIKKNTNAPNAAHSIVAESQELIICLAQLSPLIQARSNNEELNSRKAAISVEQLIIVISSCVMAFSELERSLDSFDLDQPLSRIARMKWAKEESKIAALLSRLRASTRSLNLFLTIMTCTSVDEIQTSIGHLTTVIHEVLGRTEELARRLDRIEAGVASSSRFATSRIKTWPGVNDDLSIITPQSGPEQRYSEPCSSSFATFQTSNPHLEAELRSSRVYARTLRRHSLSSLPTSSEHSNGWSCLSELSLAQISDISILSLPLSTGELWNPQPYASLSANRDQQAPTISSAIPLPIITAPSRTSTVSRTSMQTPEAPLRRWKRNSNDRTIAPNPVRSATRRFGFPLVKLASFRAQSTISIGRGTASILKTAISQPLTFDRTATGPANGVRKPNKIWLAGIGESGKSTIMKQMRIAYADGLSLIELEQARQTIICNLLLAFKCLIAEIIDMRMVYLSRAAILHKNLIQKANTYTDCPIHKDYFVAMKALWGDGSIQRILGRGRGYALYDNLEYFMARIDQVSSEYYIPCEEDLLRARLVDIGISKNVFDVHGHGYQFVDVSGHRSQRAQKWKMVLEEERPDCIIFVASLSGYNSCLLEDTTVNQFDETVSVFKSLVEHPNAKDIPLILFLNKTDCLKANMGRIIKNYWPGYTGADHHDYAAMLRSLRSKLLAASECRKDIHVFSMCAIDAQQVTRTMQRVFSILERAQYKCQTSS